MTIMADNERSQVLSAAARKGLASRWGAPRKPSSLVRLDSDAVEALSAVPERDRRRVASEAIRKAVEDYCALRKS